MHGRGVPPSVFQLEEKNPSRKKDVAGTLKGAVLKGDCEIDNLLELSVCDTKPVYFITNCVGKVE